MVFNIDELDSRVDHYGNYALDKDTAKSVLAELRWSRNVIDGAEIRISKLEAENAALREVGKDAC